MGEVEEVGYLTTSIGVAVKELIQLITQKMAFFRKGKTGEDWQCIYIYIELVGEM